MRSLTIRGPRAPTAGAPEGGDYAILEDGQIIAETFFRSSPERTHDARANALLFRGAPDLLAACRTVLMLRQLGGMMPGTREVIEAAIRQAEDAIAKATDGAQP